MAQTRSIVLTLAILAMAGLGVNLAQTSNSRLAGDWRTTGAVAIPESSTPILRAGADLGAAPAGEPLERMILLLAPSPDQQQALDRQLADLQNPSSPSFHHWATPEEFAAKYENSASDVDAVAAWLRSKGFTVAAIPAGRSWIEFS